MYYYLVVTCNHFINGPTALSATLADGTVHRDTAVTRPMRPMRPMQPMRACGPCGHPAKSSLRVLAWGATRCATARHRHFERPRNEGLQSAKRKSRTHTAWHPDGTATGDRGRPDITSGARLA